MTDQQGDIQTLGERAKAYLNQVRSEIESNRPDNGEVIVGLDPVARLYWIGKTESSILEQRQASGTNNLIYLVKLPARITNPPEKLLYALQ
jgi:hypothetical protein